MSSDSYKIFVTLSHRRIAFEYWQRDGEAKLVAMPGASWPAPLAFYCSDSGIVIGEDAARAAHNGTENAFDNYFDILVEDKTYSIGGRTKPVRNLLLDACEKIFRDFYKEVLFNRNGTLNDNRANMPLTIVCQSDIKPNERAFIHGLFKDCGYARVNVVEYERYISQFIRSSLSRDYHCSNVVVVWTEGIDLTFTLFDINGSAKPISATYSRLGIDPRKEYVVKLIWERVCGQNPWLAYQFEKEKDTIHKVAGDFLSSSDSLVRDTVQLSDHNKYQYELNRNNIDCESSAEGVSIKETLDEFLRANGISNHRDVLLLLRGDAANNSYFETNLSYGFSKTIKSDQKLRNSTMKLLIAESQNAHHDASSEIAFPRIVDVTIDLPPIAVPPVAVPPAKPQIEPQIDLIKPAKRRWREVRASAKGKINSGSIDIARKILHDFYVECQAISGSDEILAEIKTEIDNLPQEQVPQSPLDIPQVPTSTSKELSKRWREVRASAKGKSAIGKIHEAKEILTSFAAEIKMLPGGQQLLPQVQAELSLLIDASQPNIVPPPIPATTKAPKLPTDDDGQKLIKQGKLREARDWFREKSDIKMTQTLNAIIRSQRAVDMRKGGLEECRKSKNRDQINRIIKELDEYISLCIDAGVDASQYRKLVAEYKKL